MSDIEIELLRAEAEEAAARARRPNGAGTIAEMASGNWRVRVTLPGTGQSRFARTFPSREAAESALREISANPRAAKRLVRERAEKQHAAAERVYFIQDAAGGPIKIGRSVEPAARVTDLQTSHAGRLVLLATMPQGPNGEKHMHAKFRHLRMRGEWFRPAPELLEYIAALALRENASRDPVRARGTVVALRALADRIEEMLVGHPAEGA